MCACVEGDCVRMCGAVIMQYLPSSGISVAKLLSYDRELHSVSQAPTAKSERDISHWSSS